MIEIDNNAKKEGIELKSRKNKLKLEYKKAITEQLQQTAKKRRQIFPPRTLFEFSNKPKDNKFKTYLSKNDIDEFIKIKKQLKDNERKLLDERDK